MTHLKDEFVARIHEGLEVRNDSLNLRPTIEVWPAEDDFGHWVAYHEAKERAVICNTPEYKDTPYCGSGSH